jgi:hypothetical protein
MSTPGIPLDTLDGHGSISEIPWHPYDSDKIHINSMTCLHKKILIHDLFTLDCMTHLLTDG